MRMEKEKDNYYRFICLITEVGGEVQRCRLKRSYSSSNLQTLSQFLNDRDVLHTLFHLFFPAHFCCWRGCETQRARGFSKNQWNILYDADSSHCCKQNQKDVNKICICCVTSKNVNESDLDLSLLSLILNNCCNLTTTEKLAVENLRDMKNNYISHKVKWSLSNSDFHSLWYQVEHHIKHLDSTNTYLYQQQNLLHRPMDVSLMQKYYIYCLEASEQLDSEMKDLHASIDRGNKSVIEAINDLFDRWNEKMMKALQKQSTIEYKHGESKNAGDCITTKRKRQEPAVCLDVSNEEENINEDNYMSKKRKQQKLERLNLYKGHIDDLRYKLPDTKPLDKSKEYISSNLIGSKLPTAVSLQMDYKVCTMKDLTKQQGFKKANKYICGECNWLTISLYEFLKHGQQCEMRQKENIHVKNEYKKYVVARLTVPTKDKDLSSKIEKEWQQGNINPQHSSIEVNYITTGCVVIWVKVDITVFLDLQKFYSALDNLVNDIFLKYAVNLPLYRVQVYDIATGYVDILTDTFSCGDCKLTCNTLDNFISHKKTRCFQHVFSENDIRLPMDIQFNQTVGFHENVKPNSFVNLELRNLYAKSFVNEMQSEQPFTIRPREGNMEVSDISTKRIESTQCFGMTNEEKNYVRLSLLLTGISPRAIRTCFDCKFAPTCLDTSLKKEYNKLFDLKKKHIINQSQWNLLFPRFPDIPSSETFDMSLMITLLRNLTPMTPPLYGFDRLPSAMETTPAADLARIRYYRNYLAHLDEGKIDSYFFNTAWNDITSAIARLGGQQMKQECDYLKSKHLDQTKQEIMMDIKHSHSEKWEIKESFGSLKQSRTEMKISHELLQENRVVTEEMKNSQKDTVIWNIREEENYVRLSLLRTGISPHAVRTCFDCKFAPTCLDTSLKKEYNKLFDLKKKRIINQSQMDLLFSRFPVITNDILKAWKDNDDKMFINTKASQNVLECIKKNSCVTITAIPGVGKTSTLQHVALKMVEEGYEILPVTEPSDIVRFYDPNKKTVFVIDDLCGKHSVYQRDIKIWKPLMKDIKQILDKTQTKILAACRLQVYQDEKFDSLSVFKSCVCNMSSQSSCLSKIEKISMAKWYLKAKASEIGDIGDLYDFFPLLCKLYHVNPEPIVTDFFQNSFSVYEAVIDKLLKNGSYTKCSALDLYTKFNNKVNEATKTIIENMCKAYRIDRGTSRPVLQNELDSLIHTFIKKEQNKKGGNKQVYYFYTPEHVLPETTRKHH